jgi:hypothetical protein
MELIERESGLADVLVRPLSARSLPPTRPERDGILNRGQLLGICGRSRKEQMALAAQFGITDYPSPAGGCLVTDPGFAFRLKELLARGTPSVEDVELLKVGRHFRLADGTLLVMGRSAEDCGLLERFFRPGDLRIEAAGIPGPTTLLRGAASAENVRAAAALTLRYITKVRPGEVRPVEIKPVGGEPQAIGAAAADESESRRWIVSPEGIA